jgi:hypothetical protein
MTFPLFSVYRRPELAPKISHPGGQAQPLWEFEAQVVQQDGLGLVRPHHATQPDGPPVGGRAHDVGALDAAQLLQDGGRPVAQAGLCHPASAF